MNHSAFLAIDTAYWGGARGDVALYIHLMQQNANHLFTDGFDISMFYPFGQALAYSDNYILPSLIAKLFLLVGFELVAAYNLVLLLASVLNGYLTFCLARFLTNHTRASFLAGSLFMLSSFFASQWFHPQMQFAFFLPAALLASLSYLKKASLLSATALGFLVYTAFLCSAYLSIFTVLIVALTFLAYMFSRLSLLPFRTFFELFVYNIPWMVLLYLVAKPYLAVRDAFGNRSIYEAKYYSGNATSFLSTSENSYLWGDLLSQLGHYESRFFPGVLALILAGLGIWKIISKVKDRTFKFLSFAFLLSFACSVFTFSFFSEELKEMYNLSASLIALPLWLGLINCAYLCWKQKTFETILLFVGFCFFFACFGIIGGHWPTAFRPGFFNLLYQYVPGFDALRASGRTGIGASLIIALFAAQGYLLLEKRLKSLIFVPVIFLACLELKHVNFPLQAEPVAPEVYQHLATLADNDAVVALPFGIITNVERYVWLQSDYMRNLQLSHRPMVNGYSGKFPAFHQYLEKKTKNFPDQLSLSYLGRIVGLRYIVFDKRYAENFNLNLFQQRLRSLGNQLRLVHEDKQGNYLFELNAEMKLSSLELYLKPDMSRQRKVHLEMKVLDSTEPIRFTANVARKFHEQGHKVPIHKTIELAASKGWQDVVIEIPKSVHPVYMHKVLFNAPRSKILVRHKKIIDEN